MQRLILPVNRCKLTASIKTDAYYRKFGFVHYGADMVSDTGDRTLWASGNGRVIAVGNDNVVGKVIAVLYQDTYDRVTGESGDVIFRYFHLEFINVKAGVTVTKDTKLGLYGNTGSMTMAPHLHLEADLDTLYPLYSPTIYQSSFLKGRAAGANDKKTRNPFDFLYCKESGPDNQAYSTANDEFIRSEDKKIAVIR